MNCVSGKNILVVARWPLGGIRTYMRYMFGHFPASYTLTLLAASTQEDGALIEDANGYGATLRLVTSAGTGAFVRAIYHELQAGSYDLILSQGFVSATAVSLANLIRRLPHVLTIHGIVEPKYLAGRFGPFKRWLFQKILARMTVLYGVSHDILEHLYQEFPRLRAHGPQSLVILNGIEPAVCDQEPEQRLCLRAHLGLAPSVFLFGFFGRFMPQKGFDLLIDAVDRLRLLMPEQRLAVVAVGSGDYLREYQSSINEKGLGAYFHFLPFQAAVHHLYPQVDAVVIPSRWEACPLLPMEVLCMGNPVIASDCLGLRETVADTPALIFPSEDLDALVTAMSSLMHDTRKETFESFKLVARQRYDVAHAAKELCAVIDRITAKEPLQGGTC